MKGQCFDHFDRIDQAKEDFVKFHITLAEETLKKKGGSAPLSLQLRANIRGAAIKSFIQHINWERFAGAPIKTTDPVMWSAYEDYLNKHHEEKASVKQEAIEAKHLREMKRQYEMMEEQQAVAKTQEAIVQKIRNMEREKIKKAQEMKQLKRG